MLNFQDLLFTEKDETIKVSLYKYFYKEFNKSEFFDLGDFTIQDNKITIKGLDKQATAKKFMRFFGKYKRSLTHSLNKNPVIFVDEDINLPLMGLNFLGIVDKGSEMIEIKPITSCNIDCSFCSVSEGGSSKKKLDFVIDLDYLINQTKELLDFKQADNISLWINPHGEPFLYDKLVDYCNEMVQDERIKDIHIVTNATLLTKNIVDELPKEVSLSVSLSAFTEENAKKLMGKTYNLKLVLSNLEYATKKLEVILTPVLINTINNEDIKQLILYAKEHKLKISIQKFCFNKQGRNPVKEKTWGEFFKDLDILEEETNYSLKEELTKLKETKTVPDIVHKNEIIEVDLICTGRKNDFIGIIEINHTRRACTILGYSSNKKRIKVKVIQSKNNVIVVKCLR